jgi:uncharacterized metal-binding protein YceD (DUF177 family)
VSAEWSRLVRLHELGRGPVDLHLEADAAHRSQVAQRLGLESVSSLKADLRVRPWFDGAEVTGRFEAVVEQICSVTLDPFTQTVGGAIEVRVVPEGSPHASVPSEGGEVELDLEADDPPDVLAHDAIDVAAYVVEHVALELDPFPRKPGAEFDYKPPTEEESPFAVLKKLQQLKE